MEQYIPKSVLVAEIEKRWRSLANKNYKANGKYDIEISTLLSIKSFIDTLEVKDSWMPTDEQLEALEWSLRDYRNVIFEERHDILTSLYKDLKNFKQYDTQYQIKRRNKRNH